MSRIRAAKRSEAKPLIGIYSESGAGKTYSALLLARGFVGPQGRICMIETESGRGESYADPKEYPEIGGYDVLPLRDNFSPAEYGGAISEVESAKYDALIIDSASHEWEGVGGVLDMAAKNQASGKKGPLVWQQPKIDHQKHFMLRFMQTPVPLVILNMRAKYPMEEVVKNGRKEWSRSEKLDPKQSEDILFEMFVHGWIDRETHAFHPTKITNKGLVYVFSDVLQENSGAFTTSTNIGAKPITLQTGKDLAAWSKGSGKQEHQDDPIKKLAEEIRAAIIAAPSAGDLLNIMEVDLKDDLQKVAENSKAAYDFLMGVYNKRMEALK